MKRILILLLTFIILSSYTYASEHFCPDDMVRIDNFCIDKYEAPNLYREDPLVMYSMIEGEAWCQKRSKRLCYDDEWQQACVGPQNFTWLYGNQYKKGICNDSKTWMKYSKYDLRQWRKDFSNSEVDSFYQLLKNAERHSAITYDAANHIHELYQAELSGTMEECVSGYGVYDLLGNVEEWTKRRKGGKRNFNGKLKGRFWAQSRNCRQSVSNHSDNFRFYETGFRCCQDL